MKSLAFVFPGQGSQSVGMLDAWGDLAVVRQTLAEASAALDEDLGQLIHDGPKEALALTTNTQPAMLVAAVAAWRVWQDETDVMPVVMAGHSLGEYSALVAAGALQLADAVQLVRLRAQAMQDAVPAGQGGMAAILGLAADDVSRICQQVTQGLPEGEVVEAVNFNDPKQTVIAGSKMAVEQACEQLKKAGARRALPLPVSAPFHSSLMKPAAERLQTALQAVTFKPPQVPVINNVDVETPSDADAIRDALYRQAFGPVRWVETIQKMVAMDVAATIECGPGKVLTGMTRRIADNLDALAFNNLEELLQVKAFIEQT